MFSFTPAAGATTKEFTSLSIPEKELKVRPARAFGWSDGEVVFTFLLSHGCFGLEMILLKEKKIQNTQKMSTLILARTSVVKKLDEI